MQSCQITLNVNVHPLSRESDVQMVSWHRKYLDCILFSINLSFLAPEFISNCDIFSACKSCYGAESSTIRCCQTCNEVLQAFKEKGWSYNATGVRQCDSAEITKNNGLILSIFILIFI